MKTLPEGTGRFSFLIAGNTTQEKRHNNDNYRNTTYLVVGKIIQKKSIEVRALDQSPQIAAAAMSALWNLSFDEAVLAGISVDVVDKAPQSEPSLGSQFQSKVFGI